MGCDTNYSNIYVKAFFVGTSNGLESNKLTVTTKEEPVEIAWTNTTEPLTEKQQAIKIQNTSRILCNSN